MYDLSKKDPEVLKKLELLSPSQLEAIPKVIEGDGKAEFFGEGTSEEYKLMQEKDKGFLGRIFGL